MALLLLLVTVAAAIGVWHDHTVSGGWSFGSSDQSLSLLVFAIALVLFFKNAKKLCPCSKGGCCGKCGDMPCTCGNKNMK